MSKYKFSISYRNVDKDGCYCGNNQRKVIIIAQTFKEAFDKLDKLDNSEHIDIYKKILHWEAEEIMDDSEQLQSQLQEKEKIREDAINYIKNNDLYHYVYDDEELYEIIVSNKKELLEILERK